MTDPRDIEAKAWAAVVYTLAEQPVGRMLKPKAKHALADAIVGTLRERGLIAGLPSADTLKP